VLVPDPIPGDYNADGTVDAADYVVWRKAVVTQTPLDNDPIGLPIDQDQYDQWRAHFGEPSGAATGAAGAVTQQAAVPEPLSAVLMLLASASLAVNYPRRPRRLAHSVDMGRACKVN
jgi:hypothetical protein